MKITCSLLLPNAIYFLGWPSALIFNNHSLHMRILFSSPAYKHSIPVHNRSAIIQKKNGAASRLICFFIILLNDGLLRGICVAAEAILRIITKVSGRVRLHLLFCCAHRCMCMKAIYLMWQWCDACHFIHVFAAMKDNRVVYCDIESYGWTHIFISWL